MCVFLYILLQKEKHIKGTLLKMLVRDTLLAGNPGMSRIIFTCSCCRRIRSRRFQEILQFQKYSRLVTGIPYEHFEQCIHMRETFKVICSALSSLRGKRARLDKIYCLKISYFLLEKLDTRNVLRFFSFCLRDITLFWGQNNHLFFYINSFFVNQHELNVMK
jgi:hypothetical protein